MIYTSKSAEETEKIAEALAKQYPPPHTFCLSGELGAGKTAFTRGLAKGYGFDGRVSSPTFTIMNIYEGAIPVYHYDLYRINDEDELFDIGFEPSSEGGITVVEWYDMFKHLFESENVSFVCVSRGEDDCDRIIEIN